jgi:hypothetical protein
MIKNINVNAISFKNEMHSSNSYVSLFDMLWTLLFLLFTIMMNFTREAGKLFFDFNLSITKNQTNEMSE